MMEDDANFRNIISGGDGQGVQQIVVCVVVWSIPNQ